MTDEMLPPPRALGTQPTSNRRRRVAAGLDAKDHRTGLRNLERRLFLRSSLSLGAVALLSGCNLQDGDTVDKVLWAMSRWNDRVQAWLFDPERLTPTYTAADITHPFPFNAFYPVDDVPDVDGSDFRLQVSGRVASKRSWSLADLRTLPQVSQITRHVCIEGWSAIGEWSGVPFRTFLEQIGADLGARYVGFKCADRYYTSLDMPTALHPQTQLTLDFGGAELPAAYGFPLKVRVPTKLGFKNPKYIAEIFVTDDYPGGYWEDQGYNWFSGL